MGCFQSEVLMEESDSGTQFAFLLCLHHMWLSSQPGIMQPWAFTGESLEDQVDHGMSHSVNSQAWKCHRLPPPTLHCTKPVTWHLLNAKSAGKCGLFRCQERRDTRWCELQHCLPQPKSQESLHPENEHFKNQRMSISCQKHIAIHQQCWEEHGIIETK